jgi:hypothetical protein
MGPTKWEPFKGKCDDFIGHTKTVNVEPAERWSETEHQKEASFKLGSDNHNIFIL